MNKPTAEPGKPMHAGLEQWLDVRTLFGIDTDMKVPAFLRRDDHKRDDHPSDDQLCWKSPKDITDVLRHDLAHFHCQLWKELPCFACILPWGETARPCPRAHQEIVNSSTDTK